MVTKAHIEKAMSYAQYIALLEDLLAQGKTTGDNQSADQVNYAKINLQRMSRLRKTTVLSDELKTELNNIGDKYSIVIITEGWCGDASQSLPVFAAMEEFHPGLKLHLLLRDENPDLMDHYLTHGTRSIPKAICVDSKTLEQKFVWGPRPQILQQQVEEMLARKVSKEEKGLFVQNWYNKDHTAQIQIELTQVLRTL